MEKKMAFYLKNHDKMVHFPDDIGTSLQISTKQPEISI